MIKKKIPNLFIVGSAKAGTTSLYNYLKCHPDIYMCPIQDIAYFCTDIHKKSDLYHKKKKYYPYRTKKSYLNLFKKNRKVIGEVSRTYLISHDAPKKIYKFNQDAKIIILIREPIQMLYALHSIYLYYQNETICDFEKALKAEKERKKGKMIPPRVGFPGALYYSEIAKTSKYIKKYYKYFPKKQIMLILFDDLKKNPNKILNKVYEFLDVKPMNLKKFKTYNKNKKIRFVKIQSFIYTSHIKKKIRKLLPNSVKTNAKKIILNLISKNVKRPSLRKDLKRTLKKKFKKEVKALSGLLDIDLINLWDY